jgi:hypothetical protein
MARGSAVSGTRNAGRVRVRDPNPPEVCSNPRVLLRVFKHSMVFL